MSPVHSCEDEAPPLDTDSAVPQPSNALLVTSTPEMRPEEPRDIIEVSRGISMFKRLSLPWIRKSNKDPRLQEPERVSRKSRQTADHQSRSQSPARAEDLNVGPSRMAANKRVPVSALRRQSDVLCQTYHLSERSRNPFDHERFVIPRVYMQALVRHYSLNRLPRILTLVV